MEYDNNNSGMLGKNKRMREGKRDPEYSGVCEVNGVSYYLSAWVKVKKEDGSKFFSLSFRPKEESKPAQPQQQKDTEDDVPF